MTLLVGWLDGPVFCLADLSVFGQSIQKNDFEGWHGRLNSNARRSSLLLHLMIQLLEYKENDTALFLSIISLSQLLAISNKLLSRLNKIILILPGGSN